MICDLLSVIAPVLVGIAALRLCGTSPPYPATPTRSFGPKQLDDTLRRLSGGSYPAPFPSNPNNANTAMITGNLTRNSEPHPARPLPRRLTDGETYHTPLNDHGYDTLHGGWVGYDRRVWTVASRSPASVTFSLFSADGEMGFPGDVWINVTHSITENDE